MSELCNQVRPKTVINGPYMTTTTLFKKWAIQCGNCEREFWQFKWFSTKLACPYCNVVNVPEIHWIP